MAVVRASLERMLKAHGSSNLLCYFHGSIGRIRAVMHHFQGEQGQRRSIAPSRKLWTALHALDGYLTGQSDWLVNYAERHRAGLRVGHRDHRREARTNEKAFGYA